MPMQVSVLCAEGAVQEPDSLLSIRVGSSRRQGPVQLRRPCRFPERISGSTSLRVDVLRRVGSGQVEVLTEDGTHEVPIQASSSSSSSSMSVKLGVKSIPRIGRGNAEGKVKADSKAAILVESAGSHIKESELISPDSPLGVAAQSRRYLDDHNILQLVQVLLEALIHDQPEEPYEYIASFLDRLPKDQQRAVGDLLHESKGQEHRLQLGDVVQGTFPEWAAVYESVVSPGSRSLDLPGFQTAIRKVHPHLTEKQATALGSGASTSQAGEISFTEFCNAAAAVRDGSAAAAVLAGISKEQFEALADSKPAGFAIAEMPTEPVSAIARETSAKKPSLSLPAARASRDAVQDGSLSNDEEPLSPRGRSSRKSVKVDLHGDAGCPPMIKALETLFAACKDGKLEPILKSAFDNEDCDSDMELDTPPPELLSARRGGVSAEAFGGWNLQLVSAAPKKDKTDEQRSALQKALQACPLFDKRELQVQETVVEAMSIDVVHDGGCIIRQGDRAENADFFCLVSGEADCFNEDVPSDADSRGTFVRTMPAGRIFGEMSMLWCVPRSRSVYAKGSCVMGKLSQDIYQGLVVREARRSRRKREEILRKVNLFETLNNEQIAKIADALERRQYAANEVIIKQGTLGREFFIVLAGEAVVTIQTGLDQGNLDIQEHRRYYEGDAFGERALLFHSARAATVTAITEVTCLTLHRSKFERMLGSISTLHKLHYLSDPRKSIADFYKPGDNRGPRGSCVSAPQRTSSPALLSTWKPDESHRTEWFAIYRPTSREAIAKMLGGYAVGKGLNIKGKSAKKNRLSGFVPFLQISDNAHKSQVEEAPPDAWLQIYYNTWEAREKAVAEMQAVMSDEADEECGIAFIDEWTDGHQQIYGVEVPEEVVREAYIMKKDLSMIVGWETGRTSEPAFMNMNLHAVRYHSEPPVVLLQNDTAQPMNPHGLIMAYAEASIKPVVSDFDTFTVGSKYMQYTELSEEQAGIAGWSLDETMEILRKPSSATWNSRWLQVLKKAEQDGLCPMIPKYGFGDATSYRLICDVISATRESGAVRHGAECFNFFFPQELDSEYLAVWEGFPDKPWQYLSESELQNFLSVRVQEGFSFPLNPVWPVRDPGWYDLWTALREHPETSEVIKAWYPPSSGLAEKIEAAHQEFPDGFYLADTRRTSPEHPVRASNADFVTRIVERVPMRQQTMAFKRPEFTKSSTSPDRSLTIPESHDMPDRAVGVQSPMSNDDDDVGEGERVISPCQLMAPENRFDKLAARKVSQDALGFGGMRCSLTDPNRFIVRPRLSIKNPRSNFMSEQEAIQAAAASAAATSNEADSDSNTGTEGRVSPGREPQGFPSESTVTEGRVSPGREPQGFPSESTVTEGREPP